MKTTKKPNEQGFILFLMVFLLFIIAVLIITHFNRLLQQWQYNIFSEKQYYHHYNAASSVLMWGLKQTWPEPTDHWFCQQRSLVGDIRVCLKKSAQRGLVMMRGDSKILSFYLLVEYDSGGRLTYRRGHWLDYCPEKYEWQCH